MAIKIVDDCITCGACKAECPNSAIYEPGENWTLGGKEYGPDDAAPSGDTGFFSEDFYYIVPDKCTECVGFFDESQCAAVCPTESCVSDEDRVEDNDTLMAKKEKLDEIGRD